MKNQFSREFLVLACIFVSFFACKQSGKPGILDLKKYDGKWYGDDYLEDIDDAGNPFVIGSSMTLDGTKKEIYLATAGPPPMSRIADFDTVFIMQDKTVGVFKFEDSWYNKGTGYIYFQDTAVMVDIKIDERAASDMQIFEGKVVFTRGDEASIGEAAGKFEIRDNKVILAKGEVRRRIDDLAVSDEFPYGLSPTYSVSPDSTLLAYIGTTGQGPSLFLVNQNGDKEKLNGAGVLDGRTTICWSSDSRKLVFNMENQIWLKDVDNKSTGELTAPSEGNEDIRPVFKGNNKVKFFRGSRLEYSFSGCEYEVNLDGSGCVVVAGGQVIKGEDLK